MKATTKKGLIIGGVVLALGAIGFLIWRANKKNEEVTEEEATKAVEEANKIAGTNMNQTTTPSSSSTSSSGTKPSYTSSTTKAPDVKPSAKTKYVYGRTDGLIYQNLNNRPLVQAKPLGRFGKDEYIGNLTGKEFQSGQALWSLLALKKGGIGWIMAGKAYPSDTFRGAIATTK